jgi:hypothetical protein
MALNKPTEFNGVTFIHSDKLSNNLLLGVQDFLSWSFLQIGGFQNITREPAVSGSISNESFERYRLRESDDPSYDSGQVWEGFRNDWVWESGVGYQGHEPIQISGVWVDNVFYKPDDSNYSHYIDYANGRVIFDYPLLPSKEVELNFSHRTVGIALSDERFIQELMYDSYDMQDLDSYLMSASGVRSQLGERRLQLPVIAVELSRASKRKPWQLGGGQIVYNDILFHIFADNQFEKNNLRDILLQQDEKLIYLINRSYAQKNKRRGDHGFPHQLNYLGHPVPSAAMYPDMVAPTGDFGFRGKTARIDSITSTDMEPVNGWLHRSTLRATFSIISTQGDNIGDT